MRKISLLFMLQLFIFATIKAQEELQPILLQFQETRTNPTEDYFKPLSNSSISAYQSKNFISMIANEDVCNLDVSITGFTGEEYYSICSLYEGEIMSIFIADFVEGEYILTISKGHSELQGEFIVK